MWTSRNIVHVDSNKILDKHIVLFTRIDLNRLQKIDLLLKTTLVFIVIDVRTRFIRCAPGHLLSSAALLFLAIKLRCIDSTTEVDGTHFFVDHTGIFWLSSRAALWSVNHSPWFRHWCVAVVCGITRPIIVYRLVNQSFWCYLFDGPEKDRFAYCTLTDLLRICDPLERYD